MTQLSTSQAAKSLHITPETLRRHIREGRVVPTSYTAGGHARFSEMYLTSLIPIYHSGQVPTKIEYFTDQDWFELIRQNKTYQAVAMLMCLPVAITADVMQSITREWLVVGSVILAGYISALGLGHLLFHQAFVWPQTLVGILSMSFLAMILWHIGKGIFNQDIRHRRRLNALNMARMTCI